MIKKCFLLLLIAVSLPLSGCYDAVEIDDLAYVVAVGIDRGEQKTYRITLQYAVPLNIAGGIDGSPGEEAPLSAITTETDSMHLALEMANAKLAKTTDFSHLNVILLGESASKTDLSYLREDLKTLADIPKDACLAVCKGSASDKLSSVSSPLELNPSRYYTDFFAEPSSGYGLKQHLSAFLTSSSALALPYLSESETFEITHMAVLKEDTLFKLYPKEDILLYNLMTGDFQDLKYETEHGVYRLDARSTPKISVRVENIPVISVSLDLTGEPLAGRRFKGTIWLQGRVEKA